MGDGSPIVCYRVASWVERYEDHRSKPAKRLTWFPMPTRTNDDSRLMVISGERPAEAQGVWIGMLLVAASQENHPRGELRRFDGEPHTPQSLALQTGLEPEIVSREWERFVGLGLLEIAPLGNLTRLEREDMDPTPLDEALRDLGHPVMGRLSLAVQSRIREAIEMVGEDGLLDVMRQAVGRPKQERAIQYVLTQAKMRASGRAFDDSKRAPEEADVPDY